MSKKFVTAEDKVFKAVSVTEKLDTVSNEGYAVEVTPERIWIKQGNMEIALTPRVFKLISAFLVKNGVVKL